MATISQRVKSVAEQLGDEPFLTLLDAKGQATSYSYDAVYRRAQSFAAAIAGRIQTSRARIVVTMPHALDLYAAYLGTILAGHVPAMFAHPTIKHGGAEFFQTFGKLLAQVEPDVLVTTVALRDAFADKMPEAMAGVEVMVASAVTDAPLAELPSANPNDVAFIQYSSGTTGLKKGVRIRHVDLLRQVDDYGERIGAGSTDVIVSWLPLYHDMGLIACYFLPLLRGIRLVAMSPFDWVRRPESWLEAVTNFRGTLSWLPNFAYAFMAERVPATAGPFDLRSLRGIVNCSEPVQAACHDRFLQRFAASGLKRDALWTSYAMAENVFAVTSGDDGRLPSTLTVSAEAWQNEHRAAPLAQGDGNTLRFVSSGCPLPGARVEIVDEEGRSLEAGRVGEIVIDTPTLFLGYGQMVTNERTRPEGSHRTGDLGFLWEGELFVTGRKGDLIILGGKNVYPQDLESMVNEVEGVYPGRCVAFGVDDPNLGTQRLVVLAERAAEFSAESDAEVAAAIRRRLAAATDVTPSAVLVLPPRSLRKSTSGKISRRINRDRYLAAEFEKLSVETEPRDRVRAIVREVVAAKGSTDVSGLTDDVNLFAAGYLDSFDAVDLNVRLANEFGSEFAGRLVANPELSVSVATIAQSAAGLNGQSPVSCMQPSFASGDEIPLVRSAAPAARVVRGFWSRLYRLIFWIKGIRFGPGLSVGGPIELIVDGRPENIRLGANVTIRSGAMLKVRENGTINLGDGVLIDSSARIVAANDAVVRFGDGVSLGIGSIVNAGADVVVGRNSAIAGYCALLCSEHQTVEGTPIMEQPYDHAPILMGEDVWLATRVTVLPGTTIGHGVVVGAHSVVNRNLPDQHIAQGNPARVIRRRPQPSA